MADWIGYVLSFGCGVVATVIVFQLRSFVRERREFAEEDRRAAQRDRERRRTA